MSVAAANVAVMAVNGFRRVVTGGPGHPVALDESQRAVIDLPLGASAAVIGAPGTGKTTTLVELVADRVLTHCWAPHEVLALSLSRTVATKLRDVLAVRVGVPTTGPLARTVNSLAFEIVREAAKAAGSPPPRLLTGSEQDADIAALLEGHLGDEVRGGDSAGSIPVGAGPQWPENLGPQVRRLRQFRTELRELMMRATEFDVSPATLRALGLNTDRAEWVAAADFIDEYLNVVSFSRATQVDAAELARFAVAAIESDQPGERVAALKLVVIDDLHEATESTLAIVRALAARGVAIVAFGDPDVAANAFRGGEPDALGRLASVLRQPNVQQLTLSTAHRQGPQLREFTRAITTRIGTAAAGRQRQAVAGRPDVVAIPVALPVVLPVVSTVAAQPIAAPPTLALIEASSPARQWSSVARALRQQHLEQGVPWSELAVVVRSGAQVEAIARVLALADVPTRTSVGGTALRDDNAARALLTLVDVGIGRTSLTAELATALLLGPFGGLDRLSLRRLRLALRAEEFAGGGSRSADELLVEGLAEPHRLVTIDHRMARVAGALAETLALIRDGGSSIEELLWIAWSRSGLAARWYDQALGGGITAAEANRNLDGIVSLFTAAKRFAELRPNAAPGIFLTEVLDAEIPEDTLSPQPNVETVLVTTASGTVGLEFDTVVIAGLQDGAWPNLRLRGSLLGAQQLVEVVTGIDSATLNARAQVLSDELRMFALAVSRARNRVILSAVATDDEAPSPFFGLVPAGTPLLDSSGGAPLSLRGVTARLRQVLVDESMRPETRADAASSLAALAQAGVPGADPAQWYGLLEISSTAPLFEGRPVPVSPSNLDDLETSALDWFLTFIGGRDSSVTANVGTLVHWAMETTAEPSVDALWRAVQSRWEELQFDAPWLAERQQRLARELIVSLNDYLSDFRSAGKQLVGAESRFRLEIDNIQVNGSIDRVERASDGSVTIVDLKTGTPISKADVIAAHPQLSAYQLAYAAGLLDEALAQFGEHTGAGAKLLFVKEGVEGRSYREGEQQQLSADELEEFRDRIRFAATQIAATEFAGPEQLEKYAPGDTARLAMHRVKAVSSD